MEVLKGYKVVGSQLDRDLHEYGLAHSAVRKILGVDRNKAQKILIGEYPVSARTLKKIEEKVQEKNPHFTIDSYSFADAGYVSGRGIRLRKCRACGKYFELTNPRVRYCSPACSDVRRAFHSQSSTEESEESPATPATIKRDTHYYTETIYAEARRRHIDYADVQKERTLAGQPSVMQRWAAYQARHKNK